MMRKYVLRFLTGIGALTVLVAIIAGAFLAYRLNHAHPKLPPKFVLQIALPDHFQEAVTNDPLAILMEGVQPTFADYLLALSDAADDPQVVGVVADLSQTHLGFAQAQELRSVIKKFAANGKFSYAFADSYGGLEGGNTLYYLASAFDQLWVQPTGYVGLTGLGAEVPFAKGLFDKLGVEPQFGKRYEYKSAPDSLTDSAMGSTQRAELQNLLGNLNQQLLQGIADDRGLEVEDLQQTLTQAPFAADQAVALKLIDNIGYRSDVVAQAESTEVTDEDTESYQPTEKGQASDSAVKWPMVGLDDYGMRMPVAKDAPIIAVIPAEGMLLRSAGKDGLPGQDEAIAGADRLEQMIGYASENKAVKAIVIRVDSPGGDIVASDTVWHAVDQAKQKGKPVVVSMGNYAASGGYYLSLPASKILASPATITGSIGVFGGKFVIAGLLNKLGVTVEQVKTAPNALLASATTPFSPADRQLFEKSLDRSYEDFASRVAKARHLDAAQLDAVARGRVWSGQQALEKQLIDGHGGLLEAIDSARQLAGLNLDEAVDVRMYPAPHDPLQLLLQWLAGGRPQAKVELARVMSAISLQTQGLGGWLNAMLQDTPQAVMPPMRVR
jgi:protease-4